jgi:hypothetical protein
LARLSIGVDDTTNTLIVAAVDPLFEEVKLLVEQLDVAAGERNETVRVVTLHRTSATAVQKALAAFAGDSVQSSAAGGTNTASAATATPAPGTPQMPSWFSRGSGRPYGGYQGSQPSWGGRSSTYGGDSSRGYGGSSSYGGDRGRWRSYSSGGQSR